MPVQPPWLSSLPKSARMAYPMVQRGVSEGLSSRRVADALASGGIGIRRQTLLDMMRLERGVQASGSLLTHVPRNFVPAPSRLPFALHSLSSAFQYTAKVSGLLTATGQQFTGFVTVTSSSSLSPAQIEAFAEEATTRKGTEYEMEVSEVSIVRGVRSPSAAIDQ